MSNEQLYLAMGVPLIVNLLVNGLFFGFFWFYINKRLDLMETHLNARMDVMEAHFLTVWRAELRRVEEVLDARLKHLEERPR
jgi:hypothetical protein